MIKKHSSTSVILRVIIRDTAGLPKTGLAHDTAGLIISTIANNEASAVAYTQAAGNIETITTLGTYAAPTASKARFKQVDATNHPGLYEIQLANARFSVASAKELIVSVHGAASTMSVDKEIQLVAYDPDDAGDLGLTNLDAAISTRASQSSLDTLDDFVDTEVAAIKAKTDNLPSDPADASDIAASFGTVNSTLATVAGYLDTEIAAIKAKTDLIPASPASTSDITGLLTTQMTESYAADGVAPTVAQCLFMTMQAMTEFSISGTSITVKKLDGSTTAGVFTMNSATVPTSRTRSS